MIRRFIAFSLILCFGLNSITCPTAHAEESLLSRMPIALPLPGAMVSLSPAHEPLLIKGVTVHKDNPFLFDFIIDAAQSGFTGDTLKNEADRLIKYFFACLTIPEKDLWVNLSPYEKTKIIPDPLGETALGRDLLAEDYILKQLTASLIYPEKELGKEFWARVYAKARQLYGTTEIPVNTFNKVWIVANKANVYEHGQTAFVVDGHLKVMLEEDYLALEKHSSSVIASGAKQSLDQKIASSLRTASRNDTSAIGSQMVRELILPELEREVNQGKNFATLRQIFNSLILATWYKKNLKDALLNHVYTDKSTVQGLHLDGPSVNGKIYTQYLQAYKKGVFNYIKDDITQESQPIPRKYFSGGFNMNPAMLQVNAPGARQIVGEYFSNRAQVVDFRQIKVVLNVNGDSNAAMLTDEDSRRNNKQALLGVGGLLFILAVFAVVGWGVWRKYHESSKLDDQTITHTLLASASFEGNSARIGPLLLATNKLESLLSRVVLINRDKLKLSTIIQNGINATNAAEVYKLANTLNANLERLIFHVLEPLDTAAQRWMTNGLSNVEQARQDLKFKELMDVNIDAIIEQYDALLKSKTITKEQHALLAPFLKDWKENPLWKLIQNYKDEKFNLPFIMQRAINASPGEAQINSPPVLLMIPPSPAQAEAVLSVKEPQAKAALPGTNYGGIDLNASAMAMTITKDAQGGVKVNVDPAMIARIGQQGIQSAKPLIVGMTGISSAQIRMLLGFLP